MSRTNLVRYRMQRAREILVEAEDNLNQNHYKLSVNRSYYPMFTAARALLALKELDSSKHSGVITLFNQHIIKPGLFPKELGKFLPKAKNIRENADYGDFVTITKENAHIQLKCAKKFVDEAERTMQKLIEKDKKG